jgi:hypothetical protein
MLLTVLHNKDNHVLLVDPVLPNNNKGSMPTEGDHQEMDPDLINNNNHNNNNNNNKMPMEVIKPQLMETLLMVPWQNNVFLLFWCFLISDAYFLTALAALPLDQQRNIVGEKIYSMVHNEQPELAGKITGMLLDSVMIGDLIHISENPDALHGKIQEALDVLRVCFVDVMWSSSIIVMCSSDVIIYQAF